MLKQKDMNLYVSSPVLGCDVLFWKKIILSGAFEPHKPLGMRTPRITYVYYSLSFPFFIIQLRH